MNDKTPWGQSTVGVLVIQGMIGPVIGAVVGAVVALSLAQPEKVDWGRVALIALVMALAVFFLLSLMLSKLRGLVWGSIGKLLKWMRGLRVTTRKGRANLMHAGYEERSEEVTNERRLSPRPHWRVTRNDGDDWIYVHNSGYGVDDVVVHADPELFEFADGAEQGFIKGRLGDNGRGGSSGKQVAGRLTKRGEREGVTFTFAWTDQLGDAQPRTGVDGLPVSATLPARPLKPIMQPTWQIGRPKQNPAKDVFMLVNGADGFECTNVVIDAEPTYFTFMLKRELGDLAGIGGLRFAGRPTEAGRMLGATFTISYNDVNGDEHTDYLPMEFGRGW